MRTVEAVEVEKVTGANVIGSAGGGAAVGGALGGAAGLSSGLSAGLTGGALGGAGAMGALVGAGVGAAALGGWAFGSAIYEANAIAIQDFLAGGG